MSRQPVVVASTELAVRGLRSIDHIHASSRADIKEAVRLLYSCQLAAALGRPHNPQAELRIALTVTHPNAAAECDWLAPSSGKQRRGRHGHGRQLQQQQQQQPELPAATEAVAQRLGAMPEAAFLASCPASAAQLAPPLSPATVLLQARRRPLHVGGRYLKLRRGIPQSPWFIDGQRKGEGSVQVSPAGQHSTEQ